MWSSSVVQGRSAFPLTSKRSVSIHDGPPRHLFGPNLIGHPKQHPQREIGPHIPFATGRWPYPATIATGLARLEDRYFKLQRGWRRTGGLRGNEEGIKASIVTTAAAIRCTIPSIVFHLPTPPERPKISTCFPIGTWILKVPSSKPFCTSLLVVKRSNQG